MGSLDIFSHVCGGGKKTKKTQFETTSGGNFQLKRYIKQKPNPTLTLTKCFFFFFLFFFFFFFLFFFFQTKANAYQSMSTTLSQHKIKKLNLMKCNVKEMFQQKVSTCQWLCRNVHCQHLFWPLGLLGATEDAYLTASCKAVTLP